MTSGMTIGKKLLISFGWMLAASLVFGVISLYAVGRLSGSLDKAVNQTVEKLDGAYSIEVATAAMLSAQRGLFAYGYAKSPAGIGRAVQLFEGAAGQWEAALTELRPLVVTDEGKRLLAELEADLPLWRTAFAEMKRFSESGDVDASFRAGTEKGVPIYQAASSAAKKLQALQKRFLQTDRQAAAALKRGSRWTGFLLLALLLAIGAAVLATVRQINRTLQKVSAELGESAEHVASAAGQVSASSQALAQGASEQATAIEETSASNEQITTMARTNADHSATVDDLMAQSIKAVEEVNRSLDETQKSMVEINASNDQIRKIIRVIDEIAFQTNILALNAAVEAARAGETGAGFAVVADEVRNLAQRSADAAKNTASLIEESIAKSRAESDKVEAVAAAVRIVSESAAKAKTLMDEVKLASQEQASGLEQVSGAMSQMEQATQRAAASAEETAAAGEELSAQSDAMASIVARLNEMVGRGGQNLRRSA